LFLLRKAILLGCCGTFHYLYYFLCKKGEKANCLILLDMTGNVDRESEIEQTVLELISLSKRKPLRGEDKKRAEDLMMALRQRGFTNKEINELTGGAWSEPTVKLATRGNTAVDESSKQSVVSVMGEYIRSGRTISDLDSFALFKKALESAGLSYDDFTSFIAETRRQGLSHADILKVIRDIRESGIKAHALIEVNTLASEMRELGIDSGFLASMIQATKSFGDPKTVIGAVRNYGSLKATEAELQKSRADKEKLAKEVTALSQELEHNRKEAAALEKEIGEKGLILEQLDILQSSGYDLQALRDIRELSRSFGGPKHLLSAIGDYSDLGELRAKREKERTELEKIRGEHAHLQPVVLMCDELINKFGFSMESIKAVYDIARRFGNSIEVVDALGSFKDLREIKSQVDALKGEKAAQETRVATLKQDVQALQAQRDQVHESVGKTITSMEDRCNKALVNLTSKFRDDANQFGELKAEAGKLERELVLARFFLAARTFPDEMSEVPLKYMVPLIEVARNVCAAKGCNPKITPSNEVIAKYYYIRQYTQVHLIDLLDWVYDGLIQEISKGASGKGVNE
jgi:hypothetical protein